MDVSYRTRIGLVVVCGVGITLSIAIGMCRRKHVYFHEWSKAARVWASVSIRDEASNQVLLDEPTNTLFIALNGRGWRMSNRGGPVVTLSMAQGHEKSFEGFDNDLLIGADDLEIHEFKLPEGAAKRVYLAVLEQRCLDVRPLLLEVYQGPERDTLRRVLGLDGDHGSTQPATTAPAASRP